MSDIKISPEAKEYIKQKGINAISVNVVVSGSS